MNCKIVDCLNCINKNCSIDIPTILKILKPNNVNCKYYEPNIKDAYNKIKSSGGMSAILSRRKSKYNDHE